jgi:hypothetical protein
VWIWERSLLALWLGVTVMLAGEVVDLRWHLTHDEFETASDQLRAHWLTWLGAVVALAAGVVRASRGTDHNPYRLVAVFGIAYVGLGIWHFVEHVDHSDPAVAHVLIAIAKAGIVVAAVIAAVEARRTHGREVRE